MKNKIYFIGLFLFVALSVTVFGYINKKETVAVIGAMDVEIQEVQENLSH